VPGRDEEGEGPRGVDKCGEARDGEGMAMRTATVMFCGLVGNAGSLTLVFEVLLLDLGGILLLLGSGSGDTGDEDVGLRIRNTRRANGTLSLVGGESVAVVVVGVVIVVVAPG